MAASYRWEDSVGRFREILQDIGASYGGAGVVDAARMRALLDRLEAEGALTPIDLFRRFQDLSGRLDAVVLQLLDGAPSPEAFAAVTRLRQEFGAHLRNPRTQYYDAFRAKYDVCGVLLTLRNRTRFAEDVSRVFDQSHRRATHAPPALTEIRYPLD